MNDIFRHLLVLGRPACGKSEFIDFLKQSSPELRRQSLHIGNFAEVDDFPWLWEKFMEDALWEKAGYERLYTEEYMPGNPGMAPKGSKLFDWCMHKFNDVITRQYLGNSDFFRDSTLLIEFSRGGPNGFRKALQLLDPQILQPAAIFYIQVSREESWRRNVARYQDKLKHSILSHMVPQETYDFFYNFSDWEELTQNRPSGQLEIGRLSIPFVTMNNEPESTDPTLLQERYAKAMDQLWQLRRLV
jgi:hypothetical protein